MRSFICIRGGLSSEFARGNMMATELLIKDASVQMGDKLMKIIGLLSASEVVKLMDDVLLKPNPRSPNVNKITKAITRTLEENPELLQYKTKGILAAGCFISNSGKSYIVDFKTPSFGGVLDGGHNFFAILKMMLSDAVRHKHNTNTREDKRIRKEVDRVKSWRDLTERWSSYSGEVIEMLESFKRFSAQQKSHDKLYRKCSFLLPIEIISPCEGTTDREVKEIIHEISVARNNNVQLKEVAIAQHKGSYELLKVILPEEVNSKVQWKSGENDCPIPPTKIVPLSLLPLKKLEDADILQKVSELLTKSGESDDDAGTSFPPVKLMSMYTSTAGCVSIYSQVIDAVANLRDSASDEEGLVDCVNESLRVVGDLPALWDTLEYSFEDLFETSVVGNEKKYAELSCNSSAVAKKETPTRYFTRQIPVGRFIPRAGFLTPLFMSIGSAFLSLDPMEMRVRWLVSPARIEDELLSPSKQCVAMMKEYVRYIKLSDYDPSKFGKSPLAYETLNGSVAFNAWVTYVKKHS